SRQGQTAAGEDVEPMVARRVLERERDAAVQAAGSVHHEQAERCKRGGEIEIVAGRGGTGADVGAVIPAAGVQEDVASTLLAEHDGKHELEIGRDRNAEITRRANANNALDEVGQARDLAEVEVEWQGAVEARSFVEGQLQCRAVAAIAGVV